MRWARWWLVFGGLACGGKDDGDVVDSGTTEEIHEGPPDYDAMNQYELFDYVN